MEDEMIKREALKYASKKLGRVIIPYKELNANVAEYVGFIDGYKLAEKTMYSEEDMKFAYEQGARLALISQSSLARHKGEFPNPDEWFEQFKNK